MITRRTFLAAMATASLIPLAGCSSGQQPGSGQQSSGEAKEVEAKNGPEPLEITESGWSVVGDGWVYYGFALKNPNKDVEAQMPTVTITGKAEDGLQNIMAAIEQGIVMPEFTDRIAQLQAQKARAERDLASYDEARIDPEEFADFLQCGGGMDDAAVLDSFVYQVMVTPEECVATLYCDDERNEPARLSIARVRTFSGWCPICKDSRTQVLALGRSVFIRFSRAA